MLLTFLSKFFFVYIDTIVYKLIRCNKIIKSVILLLNVNNNIYIKYIFKIIIILMSN